MKFHEHAVSSIQTNDKKVPQIRLSGKWLEDCGFQAGGKFTVAELLGGLFLLVKEEEKREDG